MKRFSFTIVGIVVAALAMSGCVSILKYTPPAAEEEKPIIKMGTTGKQQPKVKVEVELLEKPDFSRFSAPKTPDSEVTGNRGNFEGGRLLLRKDFKAEAQTQPKVWWSRMPEAIPQKPAVESGPPVVEKPAVIGKYKVKKDQTLADISKAVYGTTKNWKKIYNANKDKIKDPNKIYAGQVLDIPQEEVVKHLK